MKLPQGFCVSCTSSGIKKNKKDLGLVYCQKGAVVCGYFTQNANVSYSVTVSKKNIHNIMHALIVNSGNANCFSHRKGLGDTLKIHAALAKQLKIRKKNILIASTGIIGKKLPVGKIIKSLPALTGSLRADVGGFASAILTTDAFTKVSQRTVRVGKKKVKIVGIAKGAGMIQPNMATMLAFIFTDAKLSKGTFKRASKQALVESFNAISVDGCTSTNDSVFFMASGCVATTGRREVALFSQALKEVCVDLAKMIVKDGEGSSKFITLQMSGAKTKEEAKRAALVIANSNLFKTAMYGENPNMGRIVAALGQAGIAVSEDVAIDSSSLKKKNIVIMINLKRGKAQTTVYTADLTPRYIAINAGYN